MRNILITGSARGLGKYLREYLTAQGYFIYGTTRNLETTSACPNTKFFYLDLCDKASIDALTEHFKKTGEALDGIIHNSGIAYLDPIEVLDEQEYRATFEVNFFGPIYLTKNLLPFLKKSKKGNLIFISSIVSIDCWPHLGAYSASKRALEAAAFEWATLLKRWHIHVSVIQPNPLPTDMNIQRSINASKSPYPDLENRTLEWESIEETLHLIHEILESPAPKFQYQTGSHSKKTANSFLKINALQASLVKYQDQLVSLNQ